MYQVYEMRKNYFSEQRHPHMVALKAVELSISHPLAEVSTSVRTEIKTWEINLISRTLGLTLASRAVGGVPWAWWAYRRSLLPEPQNILKRHRQSPFHRLGP